MFIKVYQAVNLGLVQVIYITLHINVKMQVTCDEILKIILAEDSSLGSLWAWGLFPVKKGISKGERY